MDSHVPSPEHQLLGNPAEWQGCVYDGTWREASRRITIREPATECPLGEVGEATPEGVLEVVRKAAIAQRAWGTCYAGQRAAILRKAADLIEMNRAEILRWVMRETGGVPAKGNLEIVAAVEELQHAAAMLIEPEGHILTSPDPERLSLARRIPLGVVAVITPWNMPLLLAMRSAAPALACGNAVVLKPDPQTAIVGGVLLCRIFEEAGLPPGIFNLVPGGAAVGEALITAPEVRMVTFTGSTAIGRRVGELAGRHLKKVALELGGNSPMIVLEDCDLPAAVSAGSFGSFFYQGQTCMATSRHIVHRQIYEAYVEGLSAQARTLRVGDPMSPGVSIGPLINLKQRDRVHGIVTNSIAQGARVCAGGTFDRLFYHPTVLADVTPQMPAFYEEIFGPVAPIVLAESDAHAVALANTTEYGLSAAIQTKSLDRALHLAKQLRSGMVHINDQTLNDLAQCPMGGVGQSGNGARFGSLTNRDEFSEWQWLTASSAPREFGL